MARTDTDYSPRPLYSLLAAREVAVGELNALLGAIPAPWSGVLVGLKGTTRLDVGNRNVSITAGSMVLFHPGQLGVRRRTRSLAEQRLAVLVFGGDGGRAHASFLERRFGSVFSLSPRDTPYVRAVRLVRRPLPKGSRMERVAHDWLVALHRHLDKHRLRLSALFKMGPEDPRLRTFSGFTVKQLATSLGYSRAYLSRMLEEHWRQSPGRVLRLQRLKLAAELLASTQDPVSQIASRAGFDSVSAFCSSFRRFYGKAPGSCRERVVADTGKANRAPLQESPRVMAHGLPEPVVPGPSGPRLPEMVTAPDWDGPYFRLLNCGEIDLPTPHPFEIAFSSLERRFIINITLEGEALFEFNGKSLRVGAGMAVVYPAPLNARLRTEPGLARWRRLWLQFSGEWAERFISEVVERHGFVHKIAPRSALLAQARRLVTLVRRGRSESPLFWSERAFHWLLDWREVLERTGTPNEVETLDLTRSQTRFLEGPPPSLRKYARYLGYSLSHLNERLKLQWNMTPGAALRAARLDFAARLLRTTSLSVLEIAKRSGYASAGPFIVAFGRRYSVTPLVYRRQAVG